MSSASFTSTMSPLVRMPTTVVGYEVCGCTDATYSGLMYTVSRLASAA
jgi:hypothetical protein